MKLSKNYKNLFIVWLKNRGNFKKSRIIIEKIWEHDKKIICKYIIVY